MYLHLGSDFVIKNTDIIAIFNIRNQKNTKEGNIFASESLRFKSSFT